MDNRKLDLDAKIGEHTSCKQKVEELGQIDEKLRNVDAENIHKFIIDWIQGALDYCTYKGSYVDFCFGKENVQSITECKVTDFVAVKCDKTCEDIANGKMIWKREQPASPSNLKTTPGGVPCQYFNGKGLVALYAEETDEIECVGLDCPVDCNITSNFDDVSWHLESDCKPTVDDQIWKTKHLVVHVEPKNGGTCPKEKWLERTEAEVPLCNNLKCIEETAEQKMVYTEDGIATGQCAQACGVSKRGESKRTVYNRNKRTQVAEDKDTYTCHPYRKFYDITCNTDIECNTDEKTPTTCTKVGKVLVLVDFSIPLLTNQVGLLAEKSSDGTTNSTLSGDTVAKENADIIRKDFKGLFLKRFRPFVTDFDPTDENSTKFGETDVVFKAFGFMKQPLDESGNTFDSFKPTKVGEYTILQQKEICSSHTMPPDNSSNPISTLMGNIDDKFSPGENDLGDALAALDAETKTGLINIIIITGTDVVNPKKAHDQIVTLSNGGVQVTTVSIKGQVDPEIAHTWVSKTTGYMAEDSDKWGGNLIQLASLGELTDYATLENLIVLSCFELYITKHVKRKQYLPVIQHTVSEEDENKDLVSKAFNFYKDYRFGEEDKAFEGKFKDCFWASLGRASELDEKDKEFLAISKANITKVKEKYYRQPDRFARCLTYLKKKECNVEFFAVLYKDPKFGLDEHKFTEDMLGEITCIPLDIKNVPFESKLWDAQTKDGENPTTVPVKRFQSKNAYEMAIYQYRYP